MVLAFFQLVTSLIAGFHGAPEKAEREQPSIEKVMNLSHCDKTSSGWRIEPGSQDMALAQLSPSH